MLTYFEITNFRCLKNIQFDLAPKNDKSQSNVAIIFGTNASGKTTLIESLEFLKNIILFPAGSKEKNLTFAGDDARHIKIKVHFRLDGNMYYYENHLFVREEFLESIFEKLEIKKYKHQLSEVLFETSMIDLTDQGFAVSSFLSKAKINNVLHQEFLAQFLSYIKNIQVISKGVEKKLGVVAKKLMQDTVLKEEFIRLFKSLDLHIENTREHRYEFFDDQVRVFFNHTDLNKELPPECESHGTIGLYVIIFYLLEAIRHQSLLLVDEIESALHPQLVELIIDALQVKRLLKRKNYPQFIFTSHRIELMKYLHSKESIFLTEKENNGATDLYCATDFKTIHSAYDAYRKYKENRLGASPNLDFSFSDMIYQLYDNYHKEM